MLPFLIEKVVISFEANGPEAFREDNIPKNNIVVLFSGNIVLGVMSILQEEHASINIELSLTMMVSHNSITLVHQKKIWSIPYFGRRTYLTTRVDNQANFFKERVYYSSNKHSKKNVNMVDDNICDDADENSLAISDKEKGSTNKRKFESKIPLGTSSDSHGSSLTEFQRFDLLEKPKKGVTLSEIDPLTSGCPQYEAEQEVENAPNIDSEDMSACCSFVLDKKLDSSSSGETKKSSHSKMKILVKCNQPLAKESFDSQCLSSPIAPASDTSKVPPIKDNINEKDMDSLSIEPKSGKEVPDNTIISSAVQDYYVGIPYDESLGKYVPRNERDETILFLTSHLKTLQEELQRWSDWANEKVMQATWRLGKDQAELKRMRQEKEDAKNVHQENNMLKETTMRRIMEMEQALVNTNSMGDTINSLLNTLEMDNVGLKKDLEAIMLSTGKHALNVNNSFAKEQEALKKCQAADMEKRSFEEDLSAIKQEKTSMQQQQEKANKVLHQYKDLFKHEESVKQRFQRQADCLKNEREQLRDKGKLQRHNFREKVERNKQKYKEEIQKCESEISQLRFQSERSITEALKRGIPQLTKGLSTYAESSDSNVVKMERECVMCMHEHISVVFLPCAHQVLCKDCNVLLQKKGMDECPSCRTPIKERISVHFPDSE
uniref:RING-type domain-containing protein n=1 Tax=Solanum lycopersicum TaxID=4081 RepID=A0A3Q7I4Y7_SOLLC